MKLYSGTEGVEGRWSYEREERWRKSEQHCQMRGSKSFEKKKNKTF
jgi:hypothetical protein